MFKLIKGLDDSIGGFELGLVVLYVVYELVGGVDFCFKLLFVGLSFFGVGFFVKGLEVW